VGLQVRRETGAGCYQARFLKGQFGEAPTRASARAQGARLRTAAPAAYLGAPMTTRSLQTSDPPN
jgi:hypothetical protein